MRWIDSSARDGLTETLESGAVGVGTGGSNVQFGVNRCAGCTVEEIFNLTKIDRRFLVQTNEVVVFEEELVRAAN